MKREGGRERKREGEKEEGELFLCVQLIVTKQKDKSEVLFRRLLKEDKGAGQWEGVTYVTVAHCLKNTDTNMAQPRAYRPYGERACNSHRACTEGKMLAVTKIPSSLALNRLKKVGPAF